MENAISISCTALLEIDNKSLECWIYSIIYSIQYSGYISTIWNILILKGVMVGRHVEYSSAIHDVDYDTSKISIQLEILQNFVTFGSKLFDAPYPGSCPKQDRAKEEVLLWWL